MKPGRIGPNSRIMQLDEAAADLLTKWEFDLKCTKSQHTHTHTHTHTHARTHTHTHTHTRTHTHTHKHTHAIGFYFCGSAKLSARFQKADFRKTSFFLDKTVWPSGLRRWVQAPVRKGVGSNPTAVSIGRAGCVGNFGFEEAKKNKNGNAGIKTCFW